MNRQNVTIRYSDKDLAEFKINVETKLNKSRSEFESLKAELLIMESNDSNRFNDINESSLSSERDYLSRMAERQVRLVRD